MSSALDVIEMSRSFLGGNRGFVAAWKAFIDESGTHSGSPVITVAAYMGRPKQWASFVPAWRAAIRPATIYHATDAASLRGEFKSWTREQVADVARRALPVICKHTELAVVGGINLNDYEQEVSGRPELKALLGSPYAACLQWVMTTVLEHKQAYFPREMISFVHEANSFRQEAHSVYNYLLEHWNHEKANIAFRFGAKERFVELQAVDVLAFESNKRLRDATRPNRKAFDALEPKSGKMAIRSYDKSNMAYLVGGLERFSFANSLGALGLE